MEFNIIENYVREIDEDSFEDDYLNATLTNHELRKKYDLSVRLFKELTDKIKAKHGLSVRPRRDNAKHYYPGDYGQYIRIVIDNEIRYMGMVPTEELAKKAVSICEKLNWDTEKCKCAIWELKSCS